MNKPEEYKNMNIWIVNHHASYYGGRHYNMGGYLAEKGHVVRVFRASTRHATGKQIRNFEHLPAAEVHNGVQFVYVKAREYGRSSKLRIWNMLDFTRNVWKAARMEGIEKPDVVLASSVHPLAWLAGRRIAKYYQVPLVLETRDLWPETFISMGTMKKNSIAAKVLYAYEKYFYNRADALVFTTEGHGEYLKERGIHRESFYINNGVDLKSFRENQELYPFVHEAFQSDENFKIIYTGSMGRANKMMDILTTAKALKDQGAQDISFYLFGQGKDEPMLREYCEKEGLDIVHFMGQVDKKYIPSILSQGDLNIFTGQSIPLYRYGTSLNKVFDYLASGKPTLSNLVCAYDLFEASGAGITMKDFTPSTMAAQVMYFKNLTEDERNRYGRKGQEAVKAFDYEILSEKYESVFHHAQKRYFEKNGGEPR